jgi:hypothetical protein
MLVVCTVGSAYITRKRATGVSPRGASLLGANAKRTHARWKRRWSIAGECREFPCRLFLNQHSRELGRWRVFYKAGRLLYSKKIGTTAWVKEKVNGKNADPKVAVERRLDWEKTQKKKQEIRRNT